MSFFPRKCHFGLTHVHVRAHAHTHTHIHTHAHTHNTHTHIHTQKPQAGARRALLGGLQSAGSRSPFQKKAGHGQPSPLKKKAQNKSCVSAEEGVAAARTSWGVWDSSSESEDSEKP
jgi:hypothetical protein